MAARQLLQAPFELLLIEQLAAGNAIHLGAQLGNAILIGEPLLGLPGEQARQHVIVEGEIGPGRERPYAHDDEAADYDPEADRSEPDLPLAVGDRVV